MVLVKAEAEGQGDSPLQKSDHSLSPPMYGEVVAVGPGRLDKLMMCKVGDNVMFPPQGHQTVQLKDGKDYLIMRETSLFGIFFEDE